jgi:hypothetical protein
MQNINLPKKQETERLLSRVNADLERSWVKAFVRQYRSAGSSPSGEQDYLKNL